MTFPLHDGAEPLLRAALADAPQLSGTCSLAAADALEILGTSAQRVFLHHLERHNHL